LVELYTALCIQAANIIAEADATLDEVKETVNKNIKHMGDMLDWGVKLFDELVPPKLAALPELAMGQFTADWDVKKAHIITIPSEETDMLGELAKKYELYLVTTAAEKDPKYEKVPYFNCAFVINPKGRVILKYRKVNPWIPLETATSPHDLLEVYEEPLFPVVETEIGNIGCYVCYDQFFPEVARQLTINGAEVLVKPTNFCAPWWSPPLEYFQLFNRVRAIENLVYGVYPNIVHRHGGYGGGGSMVVDYEGRVLASAPVGESEAVIGAPISIDALRKYREAKLHNPPKHLRTEAYDYLTKTIYKPNRLLT